MEYKQKLAKEFSKELQTLIYLHERGVMDYDTLETQKAIVIDLFYKALWLPKRSHATQTAVTKRRKKTMGK